MDSDVELLAESAIDANEARPRKKGRKPNQVPNRFGIVFVKTGGS